MKAQTLQHELELTVASLDSRTSGRPDVWPRNLPGDDNKKVRNLPTDLQQQGVRGQVRVASSALKGVYG